MDDTYGFKFTQEEAERMYETLTYLGRRWLVAGNWLATDQIALNGIGKAAIDKDEKITDLERKLAEATDQIERLRKYADHQEHCLAWHQAADDFTPCTCGLDTALTESQEDEPHRNT